MLLKSAARIGAFFTVYFLALLIQALIERELRATMRRERLKALRLFTEAERHGLSRAGRVVSHQQ